MLNRINFNLIKEIQDKTDIVAIISSFIRLTRKGNNYVGICPFHADKNPSLVVSPKKKIFKCFVCNAKGNVFGFVQQYKKVHFIEAVKIVAKVINYDISKIEVSSKDTYFDDKVKRLINANNQANEWYQGLLYNKGNVDKLNYLHNRGITDEVIKEFQFGCTPSGYDTLYKMLSNHNNMFGENRVSDLVWNEKELKEAGLITINEQGNINDFLINRITIPIYDNNGYLVAFSGRTIKKDVEPKYLNTSTTKLFSKTTTLFNFFNAKKYVDDKIIIVEGFMDAIAHVRAGFKNVVATMGVALSANHMNALSSLEYLKTVILSFDNDVAGIQATIENGRKLMENGFNVYVVGSYDKSIKDVDELIQKNGNIGICSIIENRIDFVTFLINNAFNKKMPLDEIQDSVNKIISYMVDFGNNSVLLKTQHLKLLAEKSNLNYEDIKQKYENDINKLQTADTKITHNKKIYKPTNNVGLNEKFYETEEQKNEEERPNVYKHMIGDLNNEIKMISRKLTQLYDYLIESILANPNQISKINNELNFNTQYEFIEQKLIIKAMLYLHTKGVGINSNELLKFLENKSNGSLEINWNYQKAFKYFNDFLNNPLLRFNQTIGNTKKQSRIDEIIKNIQISKYQIIILQERLNLYQLSITNKDANQKLIGELEDKITSLISNYKQFIKQSK